MSPREAEAVVSDGLMSVTQAASFLSLSRTTLWKMMERGDLPFVYLKGFGKSARRIPRKAVISFASTRVLTLGP